MFLDQMTEQYSGVVINQNDTATGAIDWRGAYGGQTIYQTFYLPSNYRVGSASIEERYPDLSGIQVMVSVDMGYASTATLDYVLDYYVEGSGWDHLASGTTIGAHYDRTIWFDMIFPQSVPIDQHIASSLLRFGVAPRLPVDAAFNSPVTVNADGSYLVGTVRIEASLTEGVPYPVTIGGQRGFLFLQDAEVTFSVQQGIGNLWYVNPTPLVPQGEAFRSDGVTPLLGSGHASLNFRILGLVADSGTDFLGNEYRSCVIRDDGSSWTSEPMPSRFAVVSRYFDVRPVPGVPALGQLNLIPNPNFDHDALGSTTPFGWRAINQGTATGHIVTVAQGINGTQALRSTSTFAGTGSGTAGVQGGATGFPLSQILDNFDRTAEDPIAGGWASGYGPFHSALGRTNGTQAERASSGFFSGASWNTPFVAPIEVYMDIPSLPAAPPPNTYVYLSWLDSLTSATPHGYFIILYEGEVVYIGRKDGTGSNIYLGSMSIAFNAGDGLGMSITLDGKITIWHRPGVSGTSWIPALSVVDTTYVNQTGYIGWSTGDGTVRFDNFGGGTISASSALAKLDIPVQGGQIYSARCDVDILSLPVGGNLQFNLLWYDPTGSLISQDSSVGATQTGLQTLTQAGVSAPSTATFLATSITCTSSTHGVADFMFDDVQVTNTQTVVPYGDGDMVDWEWIGQKGQSVSAQLLPIEAQDDTVVIDGVLLDPGASCTTCNVYYSIDDLGTTDHMTETDWEQKLWVRVPQVFVATQRQEFVFPDPVKAKYMKLEFTNLQAQHYTPGSFQAPVSYKKFPTWVADYFIVQMELPSFVANLVNVQNDALSFAYAYYLDDLHQEPAQPVADPSNQTANLTAFFNPSTATSSVDGVTLSQINLVMQNFQVPTGSLVDPSTSLGNYVRGLVNTTNQGPSTAELPTVGPSSQSIVSTLAREPVVFEQSLPVMYFFVTARHAYKELSAYFDYNRAYFATVKEATFLRHNYAIATDSSMYVESGNDTVNAEINDFVIDSDHNWYAY